MAEHQRDKEKIIDLEKQLNAKQLQLDLLLLQNDDLHQAFTEEIQNIEASARDHMKRIFNEQEKLDFELETRMRGLEARREELMKRETGSEIERRKLAEDLEQNAVTNCSLQSAAEEQRRDDEKVMKLAEKQKREKEALIERMNYLEKEFEAKLALELEMEQLRGIVNFMRHVGDEGDWNAVKKVELLLEEIRLKEEELGELLKLERGKKLDLDSGKP